MCFKGCVPMLNRRQANTFTNDILQTPPVLLQTPKVAMDKSVVGTTEFLVYIFLFE